QANLALGSFELVLLLDGHPRHPPCVRRPAHHGSGSRPSPSRGAAGAQPPRPPAARSGVCSLRDALSRVPCLSPCLLPSLFLLCFVKQSEIRSEKFPELVDAHRQNSSRGSGSSDHYCCAYDACWAHYVPPLNF